MSLRDGNIPTCIYRSRYASTYPKQGFAIIKGIDPSKRLSNNQLAMILMDRFTSTLQRKDQCSKTNGRFPTQETFQLQNYSHNNEYFRATDT